MIQDTKLLDIIREPQIEEENNPACRWAFPISPNVLASFLSRAYACEVRARGGEIENSEDVMKKIHAVSRWLSDPLRKPFLLLYGENPGTGKTTLARAILRVIRDDIPQIKADMNREYSRFQDKLETERDKEILALVTPEYVELYNTRNTYHAPNARTFWKALKEECPETYTTAKKIYIDTNEKVKMPAKKYDSITAPRLESLHFVSAHDLVRCAERFGRERLTDFSSGFLFLDDVGTEADSANFMGNKILPVVEILLERYDRRAVTIITSNLSDEGLADRYGVRVADRLNEVADKIAFMGESYRKQ